MKPMVTLKLPSTYSTGLDNMCEMVTISMALAATSVAMSAGGMVAQQLQTASAAKKAQKGEDRNFINQSKAQNEKADQLDKEAIDKKSIRAKEAMIEQGRLNVIQGESGLGGLSFEKTMDESLFNEGTDISSIESNRLASQRQLSYETENLAIQSGNRRSKIKKPDWIGGTLGVLGDAASTASSFSSRTPSSRTSSSGGFNTLRSGSNGTTQIPSGKS